MRECALYRDTATLVALYLMKPAQAQKHVSLGIGARPGPNGGAVVETVQRFGSVAKAGVVVGDEILTSNGKRIANFEEWTRDLEQIGIGNSVTLRVIRGGQTLELPMKILERKTLSLEVKALEEVLERKISP